MRRSLPLLALLLAGCESKAASRAEMDTVFIIPYRGPLYRVRPSRDVECYILGTAMSCLRIPIVRRLVPMPTPTLEAEK